MEQADQYWMWRRRNHDQFLKTHFQVSMKCTGSWEEKAFAEDAAAAAGSMGGCIWPPRSYSCSFCRREFRSAQALGGHMNVHRRDRARLKQQYSLSHHHQNPLIKSSSPPDQRTSVDHCNDIDHHYNSRASVKERGKGSSDSAAKRSLNSDIHVETNLSVGLNYVSSSCCGEEAMNYKRPKINAVSTVLPFLVLGLKPTAAGSMEADLDLELRLGSTVLPKVK